MLRLRYERRSRCGTEEGREEGASGRGNTVRLMKNLGLFLDHILQEKAVLSLTTFRGRLHSLRNNILMNVSSVAENLPELTREGKLEVWAREFV